MELIAGAGHWECYTRFHYLYLSSSFVELLIVIHMWVITLFNLFNYNFDNSYLMYVVEALLSKDSSIQISSVCNCWMSSVYRLQNHVITWKQNTYSNIEGCQFSSVLLAILFLGFKLTKPSVIMQYEAANYSIKAD